MRRDATPEPDCDLPPGQQRAIAVLAAGGKVADAAEAAGVDRSTVWRWKSSDADFVASLNTAIRETADALAADRRALASEALAAIRELMAPASPPAVRLRAALAALDVAGGVNAPDPGETDPAALRRQWDQEAAERRVLDELRRLTA